MVSRRLGAGVGKRYAHESDDTASPKLVVVPHRGPWVTSDIGFVLREASFMGQNLGSVI